MRPSLGLGPGIDSNFFRCNEVHLGGNQRIFWQRGSCLVEPHVGRVGVDEETGGEGGRRRQMEGVMGI